MPHRVIGRIELNESRLVMANELTSVTAEEVLVFTKIKLIQEQGG
jgi:hypothetical protein